MCFDLGGSYDRAARTYDRLQVIKRAASLGGVESLISMPVLTSQWGHTRRATARSRRDAGDAAAVGGAGGCGRSDRGPGSGDLRSSVTR